MRNIFTIEAIRETATHRELTSKKENCKINILETRIVRERITHAYHVFKNTGTIPSTVRNMELQIVRDLIDIHSIGYGLDRSFSMNCENLDI